MNGFCIVINKHDHRVQSNDLMERMIDPIAFKDIGAVYVQNHGAIAAAVYDQFIAQPQRLIYQDDRVFVVCDAEIYNFKDFAQNEDIKNISEAKIIADLYLKQGIYWYKNVQGVFAAFIWDYKTGNGYAYTDRIGTKPIRYFANHDCIIIASSIKSIAAFPGFKKELDYQAIFSFISMEMIPTPYTIYKSIKKLESGHVLKIGKDHIGLEMLWKMTYPDQKIASQNEIETKVYALTKEAVSASISYRNKIDEVGAFLSGGTDSSTVAGLINELHPGQAKTFSIGFDEPGYDEMYYARIAANAFKTMHTEYYITTDDIINTLPKIISDSDEPFANSSVIPAYFCAKLAHDRGIKTILGGDGGDEIFGGNERYHKHFSDLKRIPDPVNRILYPIFMRLPGWANKSILRKVNNYVMRTCGPLARNIQAFDLFNYIDPNHVFEKDFVKAQSFVLSEKITQQYLNQAGIKDKIDQYLYHDLKITLMDNDLPKVNRMTQLADVNVRYPFLYPQLLEFTGLIPPELKVHNGQLRFIFKQSFKKLLPDEIIHKTKHGFGLPVARWMLRPGKLNTLLRDILFDAKTYQRGIFKKAFLKKIYNMSLKDKTSFYGTYLYYVLIMELWFREHYDVD